MRKGQRTAAGPARVVVYLRVSTDGQVESGAGLARDEDACLAWARREGAEVIGVFREDEGVSGSTPMEERSGLALALDALPKGCVLLVAKRDRVARDVRQVLMLEALLATRKCRLVSVAGEGTDSADPNDPSAFMHRMMTDMFAQYERMMARWRTRGALRAKRARGERTGRVPIGFNLIDDGRRSRRGNLPMTLVRNEAEQGAITLIMECRAARMTFRKIARALNEAGYHTKAGKAFGHSTVAYLFHYYEGTGNGDSTGATPRRQDPGEGTPDGERSVA